MDDIICVGDKEALEEFVQDIKGKLTIKEFEVLNKFIGCNIREEGGAIYLSQPDIINSLLSVFKEELADGKT